MHTVDPMVQVIYAQSVCFALSWGLAYVLGHRLRHGHWTLSLLYVGALEAVSYMVLARLHGPVPGWPWWVAVALIVVVTIALTEHWNAVGQACMASTLSLSAYFLAAIVEITVRAHLGPASLFFSLVLLLLQVFALVLLCAGSFEILDVLCRIRWRRIADPQPTTDYFPRVSLHVPAYNEPPEMVIETLAPEQERIFRTNPEHASFVPARAMQTPAETQIKATLYLEREAALRGDVQAVLSLWDPSGVVRDARYTPGDPADDRVWSGIDSVRGRYIEEFARHRYLSLRHADASVVIEGDSAVVVNDLHAVLKTPTGIQRVSLSRGDRWTLVRKADGWRIRELIVNRSPR